MLGEFALTLNTPEIDRLLLRIERGSSSAVRQLVGSHRNQLRQMVAFRLDRRLAARIDPSDVVQDVLLQATQRLPDYISKPVLPFYPWLRQLAWNRLVDLHRHHVRSQKRSITREQSVGMELSDDSIAYFADNLASQSISPVASLIRSELRDRVRTGLKLLDGISREVLLMHYVEEMKLREIAAVLEISESAVKSRHIRALKKLSQEIRGEAGEFE